MLWSSVKGKHSRLSETAQVLETLRVNVWFNFVATKSNVADLPSRGAIGEMLDILSQFVPGVSDRDRVALVIPPHPTAPSWEEVVAALPSHRPSVGDGKRPRGSRAGRRPSGYKAHRF